MPYLDLSDPDNFTHLLQLFYAAHPQYQRDHEAVRAQTDDPSAYWVSAPITARLASWARERRLITRQTAQRLAAAAQTLSGADDPGAVITLTSRLLGDPPRRQVTVRGTEVFRWLYGVDGVIEPDAEDVALSLDAAAMVLRRCAADPEENPLVVLRAQRLLAWLAEQETP